MSKKILNFLIIFLAFSLVFQMFIETPEQDTTTESTPITFETTKRTYSQGKVIELNVFNHTENIVRFKTSCPNEPFTVYYTTPAEEEIVTSNADINCEAELDPSSKDLVVAPGKKGLLRYNYWSNSLFNRNGTYKIRANFDLEGEKFTASSNEFEIKDQGFFGKLWIGIFYQPIYNFLLFMISLMPHKSLGLAIILLTLIIRSVLFIPSQKAMRQQKKLAEVQPKLNKIREKYKNDQQKMAEETMKIWKENKVNPLGSCLPILIQFPVLIALFYVIQDGLNPDKTYLLYSSLSGFGFHDIQTVFLNILPLTTKNLFVLPVIIGGLQFFQLKLSMSNNKNSGKSEAEAVQKMMIYFMPAMIAVFTASLPAGVGLYWGTSTLFGIVQQIYVNKTN